MEKIALDESPLRDGPSASKHLVLTAHSQPTIHVFLHTNTNHHYNHTSKHQDSSYNISGPTTMNPFKCRKGEEDESMVGEENHGKEEMIEETANLSKEETAEEKMEEEDGTKTEEPKEATMEKPEGEGRRRRRQQPAGPCGRRRRRRRRRPGQGEASPRGGKP